MEDDEEMSKIRDYKQKEENIACCVSKIICSPENNLASVPEMSHYKRSTSKDKTNVTSYTVIH